MADSRYLFRSKRQRSLCGLLTPRPFLALLLHPLPVRPFIFGTPSPPSPPPSTKASLAILPLFSFRIVKLIYFFTFTFELQMGPPHPARVFYNPPFCTFVFDMSSSLPLPYVPSNTTRVLHQFASLTSQLSRSHF